MKGPGYPDTLTGGVGGGKVKMAIRPHKCQPGCYHGSQEISLAISAYPADLIESARRRGAELADVVENYLLGEIDTDTFMAVIDQIKEEWMMHEQKANGTPEP